jgi:hypothetical protein
VADREMEFGVANLRPANEEPEHTTQSVQAAVEGVTDTGDVIEFMGEKFRIAENAGIRQRRETRTRHR